MPKNEEFRNKGEGVQLESETSRAETSPLDETTLSGVQENINYREGLVDNVNEAQEYTTDELADLRQKMGLPQSSEVPASIQADESLEQNLEGDLEKDRQLEKKEIMENSQVKRADFMKQLLSTGIDAVPYLGEGSLLLKGFSGKDFLTGRELSGKERMANLVIGVMSAISLYRNGIEWKKQLLKGAAVAFRDKDDLVRLFQEMQASNDPEADPEKAVVGQSDRMLAEITERLGMSGEGDEQAKKTHSLFERIRGILPDRQKEPGVLERAEKWFLKKLIERQLPVAGALFN